MRQILLLILFFAGSWIARKLRWYQEHAQARTAAAPVTTARPAPAARVRGARTAMALPEPMVRCAECGVHAPKATPSPRAVNTSAAPSTRSATPRGRAVATHDERRAVAAGRRARLREARHAPSPNFEVRPAGAVPTLVVVHNISLPPGEFRR